MNEVGPAVSMNAISSRARNTLNVLSNWMPRWMPVTVEIVYTPMRPRMINDCVR